MDSVSPRAVLKDVANCIPERFHQNIVVIGSLAAGYHFFHDSDYTEVRTKDIDCVVMPRVKAVGISAEVTEEFLNLGWQPRESSDYPFPAPPDTPDDKLPGIRLYPPGHRSWFIELLTVPEPSQKQKRNWSRVSLKEGDAGLPAFRFLSLTTFKPQISEFGIQYARPEMMALSNLLEHPEIKRESMRSAIEGRKIKRTSKDLGRVLAIARLGDSEIVKWPTYFKEALLEYFPEEVGVLLARVGDGLRLILESEEDLEEATHANNNGLLAGSRTTVKELGATGTRFLVDVVERCEEMAAEL